MVKPPVVQCAGMLRAVGRGIDTASWAWLCEIAGQYLFMPPNVSGWDDSRWLDTATFRARWLMTQHVCEPARLDADKGATAPMDAAEPRPPGRRLLGRPVAVGPGPRGPRALRGRHARDRRQALEAKSYPVLAVNALRMLVATSPDYLTS